ALDGTVYELRVVVGNVDGDIGRQVGLEGRQHGAHALGQLQRVGRGLANDAHRNGFAPVQAYAAAVAGRALLHLRHVADAHRKVVDRADHDVAELRRRAQVGLRGDAEFTLLRLDAAGRQLQV